MALSADVNYTMLGDTSRRWVNKSSASANTFYKGALLAFNASGLLVECADTANFKFAGVSTKNQVVPSAGADIEYETGVVRVAFASAQQSDLGKLAYATADDTVALTATNIGAMGVIVGFEASTALYIDTDRRTL